MGVLRFAVHPPELADTRPELLSAYVSGLDRMPTRTRAEVADGILACSRSVPESGALNVPWRIDEFGQVMLRTATLREQPAPYHLLLEMARGKVNQLRNEVAEWEMMGLVIPDPLRREMRDVLSSLSRTLGRQDDALEAAQSATQTLARALWSAEHLTRLYAEQLFNFRHQQYPQLTTLFSCRVGKDAEAVWNSREFCQAFNAVAVQFTWKDIEPAEGEYNWEPYDELVDWCVDQKLVIKGGPLIQWSPNSLPPWLWLWEDDYDNLLTFASDFVETVIARYRGRIRLWDVVSRTNCGEALALSEDKRVGLTVRSLRVARDIDPEATYVVTLGQPWAEYMARQDYHYSPLHFADALVRADLGLGAIGLEIAMGYEKDASYCRDQMDISELLDHYAMLGMPLHVELAAPSAWSADEKASSGWSFGGGAWHQQWNEQTQADWLDQTLRLAASKPFVQGVSLSHFSDAAQHEFALAGLVRADDSPKPALDRILQFRHEHLR
jgi:hypothetical protein